METPLSRKRLSSILCLLFFGAMVMGAGPGVWLVNGKGPILGVPAVYAWAVFWFTIQASVVVTAYLKIWRAH